MYPLTLLPLLLTSPLPETPAPLDAPLFEEPAKPAWSGAITAGGIITTGNSKTKSATANAETEWKGQHNTFSGDLLWNFQGDESGVTQRKLYGKVQLDHFSGDKTYSYVNGSADHDFSAELDLRWTTGLGLGHKFRDDDKWTLSGEVGLSYVDESFKTDPLNPPPVDPDNGFLAARIGYSTKYKAGESWEFYHGGEVFPSLEDSDDIYARLDSGAKTSLTEAIFLQLQWVFDWDNTPAPGSGPKSSLFALTVGWSF